MPTGPAGRRVQPKPCSTETAVRQGWEWDTGVPGFRSTGPLGSSGYPADSSSARRRSPARPPPAGTTRGKSRLLNLGLRIAFSFYLFAWKVRSWLVTRVDNTPSARATSTRRRADGERGKEVPKRLEMRVSREACWRPPRDRGFRRQPQPHIYARDLHGRGRTGSQRNVCRRRLSLNQLTERLDPPPPRRAPRFVRDANTR